MDSAAAVAAGGARTREPKNSVHVDNNWKQRIEAEEQTETHWKSTSFVPTIREEFESCFDMLAVIVNGCSLH